MEKYARGVFVLRADAIIPSGFAQSSEKKAYVLAGFLTKARERKDLEPMFVTE